MESQLLSMKLDLTIGQRVLALAGLSLVLGTAALAEGPLIIRSLANAPRIEAAILDKTSNLLSLRLRYFNDCFAETGADPWLLPYGSGTGLLVLATPSEAGCPEILQPVTGEVLVQFPDIEGEFVLLGGGDLPHISDGHLGARCGDEWANWYD